ncbi:MAG: type I pullulanase [Acidobacteriota bacterium]|nr:type I pullulanase [Acidobacteriota bacterium]
MNTNSTARMAPIKYQATPPLAHPADGVFSSQPLGALYTPEQTIFRVWSPTAGQMTLNLYQAPTGGEAYRVSMVKLEDGCWEVVVKGDQLGAYYTYSAAGEDARFDANRELLDPYAKAVTNHDGRCIVIHDETPVSDRPSFPISEAVIYEMHLRDFTIDPDSGIQRRGKYLGLTERGTHLTGRLDVTTGLDHLVELGVNVVQLLPLGEFHNQKSEDQYGWGYDVVHHFSPEGWYATERFDARRVSEVKRMIGALHQRGIRVTLDVVFNHTFEAVDLGRVYSFDGLVPGYYYRLKHDGTYWNGSGVGNEFRTEAPMVRRYIIDCLKHWVTEYKLDGFRFDLMGLIDRETVRQIADELRAIDANLLIYGEPWAGGSTPIEITWKGTQRSQGWSVFNDHYRDALKGNVFNARETGFAQSGHHVHGVKLGIRGAIDDFSDSPLEAINYVECHDNHTLWDRLKISTIDDARITDADRRAMDKLAAAAVFTSQGIPFIQAGQEFLRTKGGDHNSYNKPDAVNMIRWRDKLEHGDVYEYYQGLIALRRVHRLFRLETAEQVRRAVNFLDDLLGLSVPSGCVAFLIEDVTEQDDWARALVVLNASARLAELNIPKGNWQVFGDNKEVGLLPLKMSSTLVSNGRASVAPRSALILGEVR